MDFEVITSKEEFPGLEERWRSFTADLPARDYYQSWDWFFPFVNYSSQAPPNLFIVLISRQGELVGIAPLGLERRGRVFHPRRLHLIGGDHSPLRTILVKPGLEEEVGRELAGFLCGPRRGDWDLIDLEYLSPTDPVVQAFTKALAGQGVALHEVHQIGNLVTDLSQGLTTEGYYQSRTRNVRKNIRGEINKINRRGRWEMTMLVRPGPELDKALQQYTEVYQQSWRPGGRDPGFQPEWARYLAQRKMLRLFMLYYRPYEESEAKLSGKDLPYPSYQAKLDPETAIPEDLEPIATELDLVYGDTVWSVMSAFKEKFYDLSPGNVLFWFVMAHFIDQGRYRLLDFQHGEQKYKYNWAELKERRRRLLGARPGRPLAWFETWFERAAVPGLRRIKRRIFSRGVG